MKSFNKVTYKHFIFILLFTFIGLFTTSCSAPNTADSKIKFNSLVNEIFKDSVTNDSITLNYTLAHPKNYGIENIKPTLGDISKTSYNESLATIENYLSRLKKMNYTSLNDNQKLIYDLLYYSLELDTSSSNLYLYSESLSKTIGIQAQLPVLLSEYNFYTKEDITNYINLLKCVPTYFNQIIEFEKEKSDAGLFMSDNSVNAIIEQCTDFISNKNDNLLITVFNDNINDFKNLSKEEITSFKKENKEAVLKSIIPAYNNLIDNLTLLKGSGKNNGGLANLKYGKKYYSYLAKSGTGSSRSVDKQYSLLQSHVNESLLSLRKLLTNDITIYERANNFKYPLDDPTCILDSLSQTITKDYPVLEDTNYTVKYIHKSLEDNLSPAFYLTPAIDNLDNNNIYINGAANYTGSRLFTTLAHEGFPGHLYQCIYFNNTKPDPIRSILNFSGYSEGWATYVEMNSYKYLDKDKNITEFLRLNKDATLCITAMIDIGVNYYAWTREETYKYIDDNLGVLDNSTKESIFNTMVEEPANYLKYAVGYLEFNELEEKAKTKLGNNFNSQSFHEFILKIGPAPFNIIDKYMELWIKSKN